MTWINIDGLRKQDVEAICNRFGVHALLIEDILSVGQRPKMDDVEGILFCLLNMLYFNEATRTVETEQISIAVGKDFVISFQEDGSRDVFDPMRNKYELWMMEAGKENSAKKLASYGAGFRYALSWSPDRKKLCYIDKAGKIKIYDLGANQTHEAGQALRYTHGDLESFSCSWSADSRWLAYQRDLANWHSAIFIYDTKNKNAQQVTSGYYNCSAPAFDPEGKYLFLLTA
ncbi:MAG TPA: CorA family divalent cation transporter [Agriterribacter sp.]|nr:CorA family divalent cation transporter [Agriterribacter sp.]